MLQSVSITDLLVERKEEEEEEGDTREETGENLKHKGNRNINKRKRFLKKKVEGQRRRERLKAWKKGKQTEKRGIGDKMT